MVNYFNSATREIAAKYAGINIPFEAEMFVDYWSHDGYLKLSVSVKELGHTIEHDEFAEKFTAKTPDRIFGMLKHLTKTVKQTAKTDELDTKDFDEQLELAMESEVYELMAMM